MPSQETPKAGPRLLRAAIASIVVVLTVAALVLFWRNHAKQVIRARLQAKLEHAQHPLLRETTASDKRFGLVLSPAQEQRVSDYDDPLLEAAFFHAQRVPPRNGKPGTGPIEYARYLTASSHMWRLSQFSTALNRPLPSRAQMASLGQITFSAFSLVQNEIQPTGNISSFGNWKSLGPTNVGGRTRSLVFDPTNPQVMYAAAASGGVWKSEDAGGTWRPIADFLANIAVNALALDPGNPSVLYAGTGEGYFNIDATRGQGIFKSTDNGAHWQQLTSTNTRDFYYVRKIVVSPKSSSRIYAATATGLLRTDDAGDHWTKVLDRESILGCLDIALQPTAPSYVFVSCGTFNPGSIMRSVDDAAQQQWDEVLRMPGMGRTSISIAPSSPSTVYALASAVSGGQFKDGLLGVYRSDHNGDHDSWAATTSNASSNVVNRLLLSNPIQAVYADCFGKDTDRFFNQGWYDNVIAVDPKDPNIVWVGGTDLFRSDDGGKNWGVASYWWFTPGEDQAYVHADHHVIAFHPAYDGQTNQIIFVGNDGGIFETRNARAAVGTDLSAVCGNASSNGVQWSVKNGNYGVTQFYSGAVLPDGSSYFGGTQDNGTVLGQSNTGADQWKSILGGDGGYVAVDPTNPSLFYAAFTGASFQKSTDAGRTFSSANSGLCTCGQGCQLPQIGCTVFPFITPFVMDSSNSKVLWTGGNQIFRSMDGAASWQPGSAAMNASNYPSDVPQTASGLLSAIAVDPKNSTVVLAGFSPSDGSGGGWIHRSDAALSTNSNTIWPRVRPRAGWVSSITFDPSDSNNVYATYSSFNSDDGADKGHVFQSTDNGKSWNVIDGTGSQSLPDIPVHSLAVDPADNKRLYVGTDLGIFVSLDRGKTWKIENSAFPNVVVQRLVFVNGAQPKIYAFTHGRGLWIVDVKR